MNKMASKTLYRQAGLPTPDHVVARRGVPVDLDAAITRLKLPIVVKPAVGGSSVGITIARSRAVLSAALEAAYAHDAVVLLEAFIEGIEITGGVLGNDRLEALPLIEIIPERGHEFFTYEAKYAVGGAQEICPARIDDELTRKAQALCIAAHQALFCRGYSRSDLMLRGRELYLLETNTIPGMTATSLLPRAARTAGMEFGQLLDRLIELSLEGRPARR
jgi:D-alanine-D-alanine ligase